MAQSTTSITGTLVQKFVVGPEFYVAVQVTGTSSYPSGGYAVTPATFGLNSFATPGDAAAVVGPTTPAFGSFAIEAENNSAFYATADAFGDLRVFYAANATTANIGTEVPSTTNVSTWSAIISAYGH